MVEEKYLWFYAACWQLPFFFFFRVLHTIFPLLRAHSIARSVTVVRSSAVQASSSRRQQRRWAIACGSPQSQSTDWSSSRYRLVGEGLNPEKINIKAFLVLICSARYQEWHIENPHECPLGKKIGRALKFMIFSCTFIGTFAPRLDISLKKIPRPSNLHTAYLSWYSMQWYSPKKYFLTGSIFFEFTNF